MSLQSDTRDYEAWLRTQCDVVEADLAYKHKRMGKSAFVFLRATYYRWARKIEAWCPQVSGGPEVLAVGDLHTENFGTWRDGEGRLVWGVNDFDEAAVMPYPLDLVRLATSAVLAPDRLLSPREAASAILAGYRKGLDNPRPTLLDEQEIWMRPFVACTDDDRSKFWKEVGKYPTAKPPKKVASGLEESLPGGARVLRFCTCVKGGGSLGRPRYVAVAEWCGGQIVREAKALVPSAWDWARLRATDRSLFVKLATGRFRSPDPFLHTDSRFIFRRIAADSRKADLGDKAGAHLGRDLMSAMGFDLAAIHAADRDSAKASAKDLQRRPADWLKAAAESAAAAVQREYEAWCAGGKPATRD
jgi:hypothetical protein